ncbi:MAG: ComF family protein [bacterium]
MLTKWLKEQTYFKGMIDFIFPPLCAGCGKFESSPSHICNKCLSQIQTFDKPICLNCEAEINSPSGCQHCNENQFPLYVYGDYHPVLKEIIIQYKFKNVLAPVDLLVDLFFKKFGDEINKIKPTVLVPIPLHPIREHQRGYNQALILAEKLSLLSEIKISTELIYRVKKRKPQAKLDFKQRRKNIDGVFEADDSHDKKESILLIDDVVTTGATVKEAKKILEAARHEVVGAAALAHGK